MFKPSRVRHFLSKTITNAQEAQNQVTVEIDNESISDLPVDVTVKIDRKSGPKI